MASDNGDAPPPMSAASLVLQDAGEFEISAGLALPAEDLLTTADLPPRVAGGDPLHALHMAKAREAGAEGAAFAYDAAAAGGDADTVAQPSISLSDATEFTIPEWLGVDADPSALLPQDRGLMTLTPPTFTWCLRTTHSDVACVMNTARVARDPTTEAAPSAPLAPGSAFTAKVKRSAASLRGLPAPSLAASPFGGSARAAGGKRGGDRGTSSRISTFGELPAAPTGGGGKVPRALLVLLLTCLVLPSALCSRRPPPLPCEVPHPPPLSSSLSCHRTLTTVER